MNENELSIREVINLLKCKWKTIVMITLLTTIISAIICYFVITPKYQSNSKVFIGKKLNYTSEYSAQDVQLYKELAGTYNDLICTDDLVERALEKNDINLNAGDVITDLKTKTNDNSQIIEIEYKNSDPELCKKVVESVTNEFIDEAHELINSVNMEIVNEAKLPSNPISPNKKLFIVFGALLGIIVSVLMIFLQNVILSDKYRH